MIAHIIDSTTKTKNYVLKNGTLIIGSYRHQNGFTTNLVLKIDNFPRKAINLNQNNMKIFRIVEKNFARLGMSSQQPRLNWQSAISFSFFSLALFCASFFFFFKANTFIEYTLNIFVTITIFTAWIGYIVMLLQKQQMFQLIDEIEVYAADSKYQN